MHTLQLFLIETPSQISKDTVEEKILHALEYSGQDWYDYYTLGGRWDDYFQQIAEEQEKELNIQLPFFLPYLNNEHIFEACIKDIEKIRNRNFLEFRDHLTGAPVAHADHNQGFFGMQTRENPEVAERLSQANKDSAIEWQRILKSPDLKTAQEGSYFNMSLYYGKKLIQLIEGKWNSDAHFYDSTRDITNLYDILEYFKTGDADKAFHNSGLVVVDFHY